MYTDPSGEIPGTPIPLPTSWWINISKRILPEALISGVVKGVGIDHLLEWGFSRVVANEFLSLPKYDGYYDQQFLLPELIITESGNKWAPRYQSRLQTGTGYGLSVNPLFTQYSEFTDQLVGRILFPALSEALLLPLSAGTYSYKGVKVISTVTKVSTVTKASTSVARSLGISGERAVGIGGGKTRIPSLTGTAKYRIPDGLSSTTLTEVKNVSRLSYTQQLRDFNLHAQKYGLRFELFTRPNTKLSGPLMEQIRSGNIILKTIPH